MVGTASPIEEGYTTICLSLASALLTATTGEVHELLRGLTTVQVRAPNAEGQGANR
jgi:hypothetical protein